MVQAFAEADDAGEAIQYAKALAGRGADQQAAIVGAQIERRENRRPAIVTVLCCCSVGELVHRLGLAPGSETVSTFCIGLGKF